MKGKSLKSCEKGCDPFIFDTATTAAAYTAATEAVT